MSLRFAPILLTLCAIVTAGVLFPATALGDEEGRLIVVLDLSGTDAKKINQDFLEIFQGTPHVVFGAEDMIDAGVRNGVREEAFWNNPELMAKVATAEGYDAVIMADVTKPRRNYVLSIFVFEAREGTIVGEHEVDIGRRTRIERATRESILAALQPHILATGQNLPPVIVTVKVSLTSTPSGATVLRDGVPIGNTPLKLEIEWSETPELWELTFDAIPAGTVRVDLTQDADYHLDLKLESDPFTDSSPSEKVALGPGRPILQVDLGTKLTTRAVDVTVKEGNELSYSSSIFPVFAASLTFFPFAIFSSSDALAGIGLFANGGIGFLETTLPLYPNATSIETDCKANDDGTVVCSTTQTQFQVGATYVWLLQSFENGQADPAGMALHFDVGYNWLVFDIDPNPTYQGHGYQGLLGHVAFSTPLGLPALRGKAGFGFLVNFGFGDGDMIADWGKNADGWGLSADAELSFEIFAGLFVKAAYELFYLSTSYGGQGCQNLPGCDPVSGSVATDLFHQINLSLGYRLH